MQVEEKTIDGEKHATARQARFRSTSCSAYQRGLFAESRSDSANGLLNGAAGLRAGSMGIVLCVRRGEGWPAVRGRPAGRVAEA